MPKKYKSLLRDVSAIKKSWSNMEYDGVLDDWYNDCLAIVESKVGSIPPHSHLFATSELFAKKYPHHTSDPKTYAIKRQYKRENIETMPEIVIDVERCLRRDKESVVFNVVAAIIEELLHVKYPDWNETRIGSLTNDLTEKYLGTKLPKQIKQESMERRRKIVNC